MDAASLLPLSLAALLYALVSKRAFGTLVSVPMAFAALGLLLGDAGLGWTGLRVTDGALHALAEVTLVLTLFADAAGVDVRRFRHRHALPSRLLGIGLPLTVLAGLGCALAVLPGLGLAEAALVAVVLAPTDASLGRAVVADRTVPERVRRALNVESGLNDGLVFPALLALASVAVVVDASGEARSALGWAGFALAQIVLGPVAGAAVGRAGARLADAAVARGWMSGSFLRLSTIALPLSAYGLAELVSGNGFLAAFACGLAVGATSTSLRAGIEDFAEAEGELLTLLVFFALGAVLLPTVLPALEWRHAAYALLSLTVVRMVPVALCLAGLGLDRATVAFLGWFGPRGLASVIYLLVLTGDYPLDAIDEIGAVVLTTVAFSIVLHGISARPLAARYAASVGGDGPGREDP